MIIENIRLQEEIRHTEAVLRGKRFVPLISILISVFLITSGLVIAATFLFGQNLPASSVGANIVGCNNPSTTTETLVIDQTRGGTGIVFVCPPIPGFGDQHYAIQPLNIGSAHWNHSAGIGGFNALYLILSYAIPTEGCHKGVSAFAGNPPIDPAWFVNITQPQGTITFFDIDHAWAYCGEYTHFGNYGPIFVSWTQ